MAEISIIRKSELEGAIRIDAEYYRPRYILTEKIFEKLGSQVKTIEELGIKVKASAFYPSIADQYSDRGVPFVRVADVVNYTVEETNLIKIPKETLEENRSIFVGIPGDIVITKGGTVANIGILPSTYSNYALCRDIILLKTSKAATINNYFLLGFLSSKFGYDQLFRGKSQSVQAHLTLPLVRNLKIACIENQQIVENIIKRALSLRNQSQSLYSQAEEMLLEELGIRDLDLSHQLFYTTSLNDTKQPHRLDAEYYQPKYERVIEEVKKKTEVKSLGELVEIRKGVEPGSEAYQNSGIPFVRVSNLTKYEINDTNQQYLSEELYTKFKPSYQPKVDEILLSKDATPGIALVVREGKQMVVSSGILRLKVVDEVSNEYLALVLNSSVVQCQIQRDAGGSIINHWRPEQIEDTVIPLLPMPKQQKLADLVIQSHQARKEAKELLEEAKEKVERMISGEDDEEIVTPVAPRVRIPKIKFTEYPMLDGSKKVLVQQVADGSIIKRFDKTPIPHLPTDVICPHFLELKWAYGCPYDCSWCYLKGTFRFSPIKASPKIKDFAKIEEHTKAFLESVEEPEILNTGEIADSLMYEGNTKSFSSFIIPIFESQDRHKVLFLTKSNRIQNLLKAESHNQVIVSFSLNADTVSKEWELKAPLPCERLKAARKLYEKGYEIRLRIDPIIPVENWERHYLELIDQIFNSLIPERITLGSLRGLQSTINGCYDRSWVRFLTERSNWGRKIEFNTRYNAYKTLIDYLKEKHNYKKIALCKETKAMWKVLNMDYQQIRCNCAW